MKNIKIYYGMSGSCKGTTISSIVESDPSTIVTNSVIKDWKFYQYGVFKDIADYNDINYGILHLVKLKEFINRNKDNSSNLIVERGITDSIFYYYYNDEFNKKVTNESSKIVSNAVMEEDKLLLKDVYNVEKILLVQNDKDFIKNSVFMDPYRNKTFKGSLDYYLELQTKYVQFTTKYNGIDKIVVIDNARDYIENKLGLTWNNETKTNNGE